MGPMVTMVLVLATANAAGAGEGSTCTQPPLHFHLGGLQVGASRIGDAFEKFGPTKGVADKGLPTARVCYSMSGGPLRYVTLATGLTGDGTVIEQVALSMQLPAGLGSDDCEARISRASDLGRVAKVVGRTPAQVQERLGSAAHKVGKEWQYRSTWSRPGKRILLDAGGGVPVPLGGDMVLGVCGVVVTFDGGIATVIEVFWRESR